MAVKWLTDVTPCSNSPTTSNSFTSFNNPKRQPAGLVNVEKKKPQNKNQATKIRKGNMLLQTEAKPWQLLSILYKKAILKWLFWGVG